MSAHQTHLRIQKEIQQVLPTAVLEKRFQAIGRIADVVWEEQKIVFEVQFSPIHPIEARERTRDYATLGYQVVWILHENMFNPLRPTPFQDFLKYFTHFYTNIDDLLGGEIYRVEINGLQIQRRAVHLNKFDFKRSFHLRWPFMKKIYRVCAFTLILLASKQLESAVCDGTWESTNTLWNDPASWSSNPCFPQLPGDVANFANTGSTTVSLNFDFFSIGTLNFEANAQNYIMNTGGGLSLDNAPSFTAFLNVLNGTQTIDVPVTLDTLATTFTVDSNLGFTFNSTVTGSSTLTATGSASGIIDNDSPMFNPANLLLNTITFINSGTISLSASDAFFNIASGTFSNVGTFNLPVTGGTLEIFSGTVSNSGSLANQSGVVFSMTGGTFTNTAGSALNNASSITVTNSTLQNLSGASFALTLPAGAPMTINTSTVVNGAGSMFGASTSNISVTDSSFTNGGTLFGDTLSLTQSSLVNSGLVSLAGDLTLSNSSFINNNTVDLPGVGVLTIPAGSTVSGNGKFLETFDTFNSGLVIPGNVNAPGTLTFTNTNFNQDPDGTLQINVGNGAAGQLAVGTADLSGTLNIVALPGLFEAGVYTILSTTNPVDPGMGYTGTFDTINFLNFPPAITHTLTFDPYDIILEIGVSSITGFFGNYYYMVFSSLNQVNFFLTKHMDWLNQHYFCEFDPCGKQLCCRNPYQWNIYAGPIGSIGNIESHGTQYGMTYNTEGFIAGLDYIMNCAALGIEFDYERMNSRIRRHHGMIDNDHYSINVYGAYTPFNELAITGIIGGGGDQLKTKRPGIPGTPILGSAGAHHFEGLLGLHYTISRRNVPFLQPEILVTPIATAQFMSLTVEGYNERNLRGLQASFTKQKYQSVRTNLGFLASWSFLLNGMKCLPEINFAWQREFYDDQRDLHFEIADTFTDQFLKILPASRNVYLAGLDLVLELADLFRLQAGYEFEGNSYYTNHFFTVTFNKSF